jgi:hypothetical protein
MKILNLEISRPENVKSQCLNVTSDSFKDQRTVAVPRPDRIKIHHIVSYLLNVEVWRCTGIHVSQGDEGTDFQ